MLVEMIVFHLLAIVTLGSAALSEDPTPLVISGHVTIGVLTQLRRDATGSGRCTGPIKSWALQEVAALEWALITINNQSDHHFAVGLKVYDNCGDKDRLTRQTVNLMKEVQNSTHPIIGIISLGDLPSIKTVSTLLHAYSLPLLTTQTPSEEILKDQNVFTTAPHLHAQMQAVMSVVGRQRKHFGMLESVRRIGVISGCHSALQILESIAGKEQVNIDSTILVEANNKTKLTLDAEMFLKSQVGFQGTVILLLDTSSINYLIENLEEVLIQRAESFWIFSVLDGEPVDNSLNFKKMSESFHMSALVEPFSPLLPGLGLHLNNSLTSNTSLVSSLTGLVPAVKLCSSQDHQHMDCEEMKTYPLLSGSRSTSIIKAISTLVAAFRLVQIDRCPNNGVCPKVFEGEIGQDMVQSLEKLSYNAQETSDNIRYTADGRFLMSFIISRVHSSGLQQVGKYREDNGVVWTHPLPMMNHQKATLDAVRDARLRANNKRTLDALLKIIQNEDYLNGDPRLVKETQPIIRRTADIFDYNNEHGNVGGIFYEIVNYHQDTLGKIYAITVMCWAILGVTAVIYIGYYILKSWQGSVTSSKILDILLLIGIQCSFWFSFLYLLPPTLLRCQLRVVLQPIALAMCFGIIMLQTMQLRASESLGLTGETSKIYTSVTLLFITGVQVILSLISQKDLLDQKKSTPVVELGLNGARICRRETLPALIMQEYLLILLVFSIVIGMTNRKSKEENVDSRRLLMASTFAVMVIVAMMIITISSSTCVVVIGTCLICLILATSLLTIVFGPRVATILMQTRKIKKKLNATPPICSISNDGVIRGFIHTVMPPPLRFSDPPRSHTFNGSPPMRPWRLDPYESPILRHSIPPPPPPPIRVYNNRSNSCPHQ